MDQYNVVLLSKYFPDGSNGYGLVDTSVVVSGHYQGYVVAVFSNVMFANDVCDALNGS